MLDPVIAEQLRRRGHDVESILKDHPELVSANDDVVLEAAVVLGRMLVTDNVRHFIALHATYLQEGRTHAGILLADSRRYPRSKKTVGLWVRGLEGVLTKIEAASMHNALGWLE